MYTSVMYVYLLIFMLMQCCVTNMLLCCGNKLTYLLTYLNRSGRYDFGEIFPGASNLTVKPKRKINNSLYLWTPGSIIIN